ncbi:formate dehydrogenase accessory sulfurtransferase FdhD [Sediminivirga luteola]|uniref:Sulfur carrier protein FdhD n=1 Tax=Sediminivirga luteola TaxID=1774748 RepID=A0A8J2U183_9MICO|nr:formate dehydrogenase accessory sulfurtransferase FdhD [Sediminivirga luteola]MCI2265642.1 formate dehydrogenase accessory sulfurtransferase FdhD [Sediminivirga luteola]GGA28243.1 sulfurtransferase FdhD [Sediminivirga luteola]
MNRLSTRRRIVRYRLDEGRPRRREDQLAGEEPLELRFGDTPYTTTMRTPGHDVELVLGFLHGEGIIASAQDLLAVRYCAGVDENGENTFNVLQATPAPTADLSRMVPRPIMTTSACGVCGTESIEQVRQRSRYALGVAQWTVSPQTVAGLPETMRDEQGLFSRTGGVHAAGLFGLDGELLCLREDVGRHNAVDKVVGWALQQDRLPLSQCMLQVSGRASFELVQKAWLAGIPMLAAVSAPSSLAVSTAEEAGMTLVGFSRGTGFNVYSGAERIALG